ncbi:hypothetical protein D3C76_1751390 [compost metagenome]
MPAMKHPSKPPNTATQARNGTLCSPLIGRLHGARVDGGHHRHTGQYLQAVCWSVEHDAYRKALDDLGEIAGGVV